MKSNIYGSFITDAARIHRLFFWCAGTGSQY